MIAHRGIFLKDLAIYVPLFEQGHHVAYIERQTLEEIGPPAIYRNNN